MTMTMRVVFAGEICERYHELIQPPVQTVGLYITPDDAGKIEAKLRAAAKVC